MSRNFLDMSDDDFMNLPQDEQEESEASNQNEDNPSTEQSEETQAAAPEAENADEGEKGGEDTSSTGSENEDNVEGEKEEEKPETPDEKLDEEKPSKEEDVKPDTADKKEKQEDKKPDTKEATEKKAEAPVNYEEAYKKIMAPFKANGRQITLKDPQEVIKMMQLGANYTKKMQSLQPSMKILRMLQDNGLHDEDTINSAIDVLKGDKGAIQNFLKQKNIDPLDFDPDSAKGYKPANHKISDSTMELVSTLDSINESEHGQAIVKDANTWDKASKEAIFKNPQVLTLLAEHRENGVYSKIADEIEKHRALGNSEIARLPFLHAYKVVGDQMEKQGLFAPQTAPATQQEDSKPAPQVLAKKAAPRKTTETNGERVKAASPTQASAKKAESTVNPLAMSDEDFLKQMANRV